MKLLAIDTSGEACSVALLLDEQISSRHVLAPMQQAKSILPMVQELLNSKNCKVDQLDAIAFGCGPGSFTGVRIGVSVAQGLAFAAQLPMISISSLAANAQGAYEELGWKNILVAIDARMKEVYWAAYQVLDDGLVHLVGKESVSPPEELTQEGNWYGIGNAWSEYPNLIPFKPVDLDTKRLPLATAILSLAKPKYQNQEWVRASEAIPVYLRDHVAKKMNNQSSSFKKGD